LVRDVELFGKPELCDPATVPLSELVAPGVPYPLLVALAGDTVLGVASVLLLCA
jgi:hypothetical protein